MSAFKLAWLVPLLPLAACTSHWAEPMNRQVDKTHEAANRALENAKKGHNTPPEADVARHGGYYIPTEPLATEKRLPGPLAGERVVFSARLGSLREAAGLLGELTGLPTVVEEAPQRGGEKEKGKKEGSSGQPFIVRHEGTLAGLLERIAAHYGYFWRVSGNRIEFYATESRTFRVFALPGDLSSRNTVTNATGSSDEGSSQATSSATNETGSSTGRSISETDISISRLSVWSALEKAVSAMLSGNGQVVVTPATGTITVTDTPAVLRRVGHYLDEQNRALSRRVHLGVRVFAVTLNDAEQYGINWDMLFSSAAGHLGSSLANSFSTDDAASRLTFRILPGQKGSNFSGTSVIASALSGQGRVASLTSATLTTLNNQPAPLLVGRQTAYLKNASTTLTDGSSVSSSLNPGTVNTGFSMTVLPHVMENGRMLLQLSVDVSSLAALNQVSSGNAMIQTPEVDTRNFLQRVMMNSGDTLVLAGFEQNLASTSASGVGSPDFALFGGGRNAEKAKTVMVIVLEANLAEEAYAH